MAMSEVPAVKECTLPPEWHKKFYELYKAKNPDAQLIGLEWKTWKKSLKRDSDNFFQNKPKDFVYIADHIAVHDTREIKTVTQSNHIFYLVTRMRIYS